MKDTSHLGTTDSEVMTIAAALVIPTADSPELDLVLQGQTLAVGLRRQ